MLERLPWLGHCCAAETADDHMSAWFQFVKPALGKIIRKGDKKFPPRLESKEDVIVMISNHLSDLDHFLITAQADRHLDGAFPLKITGFTQSRFSNVPLLGSMVGKFVIGIGSGSAKEQIQQQVCDFLHKGYNAFLLFPEGRIFCKSAYSDSIVFQQKTQPDKMLMHDVLFPRYGAFCALVEALGPRLKYIVDITLDYPHHPLRHNEWQHFLYPSVFFSYFNDTPPPTMHVTTTRVDDWTVCNKKLLLQIWMRKNSLLKKKLRPVWQLHGQSNPRTH